MLQLFSSVLKVADEILIIWNSAAVVLNVRYCKCGLCQLAPDILVYKYMLFVFGLFLIQF